MIIKVANTLDKHAPYSFTTADINAGTSIPIKNISQFYASWAIQAGKTGEEKSEIRVLTSSSPSGTALSVTSALSFDHPADTPIYAIKFDKVIFKRSTSGTSGSATAMTNGTIAIAPDFPYTIFDDTSGATTYAYKAQYYNSVTGDLSQESDWLTPSGYTFYSKFSLRERVKNSLFSANRDDSVIDEWVNEWYEEMNNAAVKTNQDYNIGTVAVAFGTNGYGTVTSTDFKDIRKLDITTDGSEYFRANKSTTIDIYPADTFNSSSPFFYMEGDNIFVVKNGNIAGTAVVTYYKLSNPLSDDTDELPLPMRSYSKSFVDYARAQSYYFDMKEGLGDRFMNAAREGKDNFIREIAPRTKTGPQYIQIVESISGEDYFGYF